MSIENYIESLKNYKGFKGDIVCHRVIQAKQGVYADALPDLKNNPESILRALGIKQLYQHQKQAVNRILAGRHTVIATPTASGKSMAYNLPVIDSLIEDPDAHALYLFPLKALARDQMETLKTLLAAAGNASMDHPVLRADVYDGDISSYKKTKIRKAPPHVLLSNPEMLHLALLAHHRLWENFFRGLKYVVVDEVHTYRGVMGSNMAWVFRRLLRICRLYGASPVFIFCSATIANPAGLCNALTGLDVEVVDGSGAPAGKKDVILMRGLDGAARTAITLIHSSLPRELRTICYTQSRKITELIAIWASHQAEAFSDRISSYRAGFLPEERRMIEQQMASGELLCVVSTSALELGIDIGALDLCILVGYPGTIMSTWQRAGRVGRKGRDAAMILIAHEDALDQYFINHPDEFFNMPPETAMVNPENPVILKRHLECAAAELTLESSEPFLGSGLVQQALEKLERSAVLLKSRNGKLWFAARKNPHREVNLRGAGDRMPIFLENSKKSLGEIDRHRSFFETHEGAVYLHRGETYVISRFDHEKGIVEARPEQVNYYTRARSSKDTTILSQEKSRMVAGTRVGYGRLKITEQVTGYDRRRVSNQKSLGVVPLDLPELEFTTQGIWIEIPDEVRETVESAQQHFMGGIHALEHAAIGMMPLLVMTDRNDIGGISIPFHPQVGKAAVFIYDGTPGGMGFSRQAFENAEILLQRTLDAIRSCSCENGCPCCVHSPKCGSGNRPIDKHAAGKILELVLSGTVQESFAPIRIKSVQHVSESLTRYGSGTVAQQEQPFESPALKDVLPLREKRDLHYTVLDIETRRSAKEVGGWHRADRMGMSCAVVYDSDKDGYVTYYQDDIEALIRHIKNCDLVIGFNIIRFDYKVLSGLSDFDFHQLPTLDMLTAVHEYLGYRLSLDHLAENTLGTAKSADGLMALKWWQEGKIDQIVEYCTQDVRVTRDLFRYGADNGYLLFKNKAGHRVRVPAGWAPGRDSKTASDSTEG